jgi:hypothetical protein
MEKRKKNVWWGWWLVVGVLLLLAGFRDWLAPGFLSLYNPRRYPRPTPWGGIAVEALGGVVIII